MALFEKHLSKFDVNQIIELNEKGLNIKQIAEVIEIPSRRLGEMIKHFKVPIKKGFTKKVNDSFFDVIDSEEKAYLLGFFIADGYIQKEAKRRNGEIYSYSYRMGINNSINDIEAITLFRDCICPDTELNPVNKSTSTIVRKDQITLRWNSKHMLETLESYGIKSRKTYDQSFKLPDELIPEELMRHFVRGYFDGDGHKGKSYIELCINSKYFAKQIISFFEKNGLNKHRLTEIEGKTVVYYKLCITGGKEALLKIKDLFYENSKHYLTRKYVLFNAEVTD